MLAEARARGPLARRRLARALGVSVVDWYRGLTWSVTQRLVAVGVALVVVALFATDGFLFSQRNAVTKVTFGHALSEFRATQTRGPVVGSGDPQPSPGPAGAADAPGPGTVGLPVRPGPLGAASSRSTTANAPAVPASVTPFVLPATGVYTYRTTGGEQISVLGSRHNYPPETYATVRYLSGCQWQIENDVIQEHVDKRTVCSRPGQLLQLAQSRMVTFYGKTDGSNYVCNPPQVMINAGEPAGTTHDALCGDSRGQARIHAVDDGHATLNVGNAPVDTIHLVLDSTLSGRASGKAHDEFWVTPDSGMVVQWVRSVDTNADAAFGANVHYNENASFLLESLKPAT